MHTHTHTHTHTHKHTHMHTQCTFFNGRLKRSWLISSLPLAYFKCQQEIILQLVAVLSLWLSHTSAALFVHTRLALYVPTQLLTHIRTHARTRTHSHTHTYTHMHTHAHSHARTHAHSYKYTDPRPPLYLVVPHTWGVMSTCVVNQV